MRSRVIPGSLVTMARRVPVKRLKSVDLPTLGRPTMTKDGRCAVMNLGGSAIFHSNVSGPKPEDAFHYFYGDSFATELPTGSGEKASLWQAAAEISRRLTRIFLRSRRIRSICAKSQSRRWKMSRAAE